MEKIFAMLVGLAQLTNSCSISSCCECAQIVHLVSCRPLLTDRAPSDFLVNDLCLFKIRTPCPRAR
jgi:hypothetical protein